MVEWIARNGWVAWPIFVVLAVVVFRMRGRGGDEFLLRRILFALFPPADPCSAGRGAITPMAVFLVVAGIFLAVLLRALIVWLSP